jgi:ribosomal protein S18 acetylase RimI-like enzyme
MNLEHTNQVSIELLNAISSLEHVPVLIEILQDSINSGASIGYLPPFSDLDARDYWTGVLEKVAKGSVLLWVARDAELGVVGTVQLEFASKTNALHRAEVCKLLVHQRARRRGVARGLMLELLRVAGEMNRTTLVLDTREGDPSNILYQSLGFQISGLIPDYVTNEHGEFQATVIYFKLLNA